MKSVLILVLSFLTCSCTSGPKKEEKLTEVQAKAFDALDMIQVSTDVKNRLYSTFPNIVQPCYPEDTSFVISQSKFLYAMKFFTEDKCGNLPMEQQDLLAESSAKAQEEYHVLHCSDDSENEDYSGGLPMTGTWVLLNVLGRRDVTLIW